MTKVYLVWRGEYSDERVIAVYDNERDAGILAGHYSDGYYTEEPLNSVSAAAPRYRWDVLVRRDNSEIVKADNLGEFGTESPRVVEDPNPYRYQKTVELFGDKGTFSGSVPVYRAVVYAEDKAKALKAATDAVAKYKAEEQGL